MTTLLVRQHLLFQIHICTFSARSLTEIASPHPAVATTTIKESPTVAETNTAATTATSSKPPTIRNLEVEEAEAAEYFAEEDANIKRSTA
jgi:hypothetical protein